MNSEKTKTSSIRVLLGYAFALFIALASTGLAGCSSPKNIAYLQDTTMGVSTPAPAPAAIVARPGDRLSIVVSCSDPKTASMFALISPQRQYNIGESEGGQVRMSDYQVGDDGNIDFPILGEIHVAGLTAPQVAEKIQKELVSRKLAKDAVVVADLTNLHYSVLGEVNNPGRYNITNNRVTLMEALATAGDLTIFGKRENVKVIREENGQRMTYVVDLRDSRMFDSPAYYLQQNDVVYVEPNKTKTGQSTVNENQWKTPGLWISIASFLTTIGVLIFK